jgi:hypothetical protein
MKIDIYFFKTMLLPENEFTVTPQLNPEKSTKKEKEVMENNSEIYETNYVDEPTSCFIDEKSEDLFKNRLIFRERRNLVKEKKVDVVAEKLRNTQISEEKISNNTNREPVVIVSLNHFLCFREHFFEITKGSCNSPYW